VTFVLSIWLAPKLCLELGKYNNFLRKTSGIDDYLYIWAMENKKEVATVRKGGVSANADREHPEAINDNRDGCPVVVTPVIVCITEKSVFYYLTTVVNWPDGVKTCSHDIYSCPLEEAINLFKDRQFVIVPQNIFVDHVNIPDNIRAYL